jgi:glycosyltransferase involved in cell wall biosynthesis
LIRELGLERSAHLAGQQESMMELYESLDLLVSASRQEGLPIALLEGMASGLPLVATAVGAVPSLVVDGETGLLVDAGSPEFLSQAMLRLLPDVRARECFGRAGRDRVLAEFSAQRMAAEYLTVYQHALARYSPSGAPARQGES